MQHNLPPHLPQNLMDEFHLADPEPVARTAAAQAIENFDMAASGGLPLPDDELGDYLWGLKADRQDWLRVELAPEPEAIPIALRLLSEHVDQVWNVLGLTNQQMAEQAAMLAVTERARTALEAARQRLQETGDAVRNRRSWLPEEALLPELAAARAAAMDIFEASVAGAEDVAPEMVTEARQQLGSDAVRFDQAMRQHNDAMAEREVDEEAAREQAVGVAMALLGLMRAALLAAPEPEFRARFNEIERTALRLYDELTHPRHLTAQGLVAYRRDRLQELIAAAWREIVEAREDNEWAEKTQRGETPRGRAGNPTETTDEEEAEDQADGEVDATATAAAAAAVAPAPQGAETEPKPKPAAAAAVAVEKAEEQEETAKPEHEPTAAATSATTEEEVEAEAAAPALVPAAAAFAAAKDAPAVVALAPALAAEAATAKGKGKDVEEPADRKGRAMPMGA